MMPEAINAELSREPFVAIRLHLSNGEFYEIRNPGLCWINRGSVYIARTDRPNSHLMDDVDLISVRHIVRVEQVYGH